MKKVLLTLSFLMVYGLGLVVGQTSTITGTVTGSEDGMVIPGVSVFVKGTTLGTVTQPDGTYSLNVPQDAEILVYTFVGLRRLEVPIQGRTVIDVQLESESIAMDEVVVTALGIKRKEKSLGYAVTNVSGDELTRTRTTDVMGAIAGKVAGVDVSLGSSSPGASNAVIIRGMSSLGGSNQPLYVVDGVPIINNATIADDGLNSAFDFGAGNQMVNPDDVASISILKGAAASALYGNRASNGVILITTKQGRKNEDINIVVNSTVEMSDILRLPEYQNEFGMGWDGHHTLLENGSWGPRFDGSLRLWGTVYNHSQKLKPFVAMPDNVRDFFDYGWKYQNSVSLSGGSESTTYYASFSQVNEDGIVPTNNDEYDKYTASFRGTHEVGKLTISSSVNLSRQNNHFVPTGQGFTVINNITQIPRDISIVGLRDYRTDPFDNLDYYFTPYGVINPYYALENMLTQYESQKIFGKMQLDLELMEGLVGTYRIGFDGTDSEYKIARPRLVTNEGTPNFGEVSEPGIVNKNMSRRMEMNHDLFLNYSTEMDDFFFDVVAGVNLFDTKYSSLDAEIANLDIPDFYDLSNTSETPSVDEDYTRKRMVGVYGNLEVAWRETLFLTLTGRNDWTSTLPKDNNSYFYPGVQLSFAFSNYLPESWKSFVDFGKLRFAWGRTGKDADVYLLDPYFISGSIDNPFGDINFPLSGQNSFEVGNRLANLSLQPEIRTETEVGMRMDFFRGRVGFDVTYYESISDKQIFNLGLDPSTGYTSQTTNLGEIENKGFEVLLNLVPVRMPDFEWELSLNFTDNDETLVSLPEELGEKISLGGTNQLSYVAQVGGPLGLFEVTVPEKTAQGKIVVDDDGNPVAAAEKAIIPKAAFDYMLGISNSFSYKGFNLSFDFDIRQGGLIYSRTKDVNLFTGNLIETTYNSRNPFVIPNSVVAIEDADGQMDADGSDENDYVENSTPINNSTLVNYWADGAERLNEAYLLPRSYVKLKRMSFAYDLPKRWLNNLPVKGVNVSVFGNNLLLWTPKENHHIDPEATTFGNDLESKYGEFSVNPPTRRFGVNFRLTF